MGSLAKGIGFAKQLSCVLCVLMAFAGVGLCYKVCKVRAKLVYASFVKKFTEPIEVCYLLTSDFTVYRITSNNEIRINFKMFDLKRILKKGGHEMSDIIVIIHNHLPATSRYFSMMDIQTWYDFKRMGFDGNYYLLYQGNKVIYELIEDEDDC